jgi:hypothetical protein
MRERAYPPIHEWSGQVADAVAARLVHEAIAHALGMQQDLEACGRWAVAGLTDDQHERVAVRLMRVHDRLAAEFDEPTDQEVES